MNKVLNDIYTARNVRGKNKDGAHGAFAEERGTIFPEWIGTGKKVLDLGCCNCSLTKRFLSGNTVTGFDVDKHALALCDTRISTEQHDLNGDWHIGTQRTFDVVVSTEVVEHLYHPKRVLGKVAYVLKDDGVFIGSVPNAFNLKNRFRLFFAQKDATPLGEPTHIHHFSYQELHALLSAQFECVEIVPMVQKKWQWFARIFPGLGSFLLLFKASRPKRGNDV